LEIDEHLVTNDIFTDESPFHFNGNLSTQNQRVYTKYFFEPKETLGAEHYIELLGEVILPVGEEVYPDGNFLYQQDGAGTKHKNTQRFLEERAPQFVRLNEWSGYSPDLNPCDYRLWAWLKQKVYSRGMPPNLDELKDRIREAWKELDTETIRGWLQELRPRLEKIIEENGQSIQQYFNKIFFYCFLLLNVIVSCLDVVFMRFRRAQSISRIKIPLIGIVLTNFRKNRKISVFWGHPVK
jgi:hypothetical protein